MALAGLSSFHFISSAAHAGPLPALQSETVTAAALQLLEAAVSLLSLPIPAAVPAAALAAAAAVTPSSTTATAPHTLGFRHPNTAQYICNTA